MKLWLLTQDDNISGSLCYDAMIVAAETENEARLIVPDDAPYGGWRITWANSPESVTSKLIGEAIEGTQSGFILGHQIGYIE